MLLNYTISACIVTVVATNTAGGDPQFLHISFTPAAATAAFPAVNQPTVLVAPTQQLPVLAAAASRAVVPGSPTWMQVMSLPPVIVKQEKSAITFSTHSTVSHLTSNR